MRLPLTLDQKMNGKSVKVMDLSQLYISRYFQGKVTVSISQSQTARPPVSQEYMRMDLYGCYAHQPFLSTLLPLRRRQGGS